MLEPLSSCLMKLSQVWAGGAGQGVQRTAVLQEPLSCTHGSIAFWGFCPGHERGQQGMRARMGGLYVGANWLGKSRPDEGSQTLNFNNVFG